MSLAASFIILGTDEIRFDVNWLPILVLRVHKDLGAALRYVSYLWAAIWMRVILSDYVLVGGNSSYGPLLSL
jgi:hypothetical protein